MTYDLECEECKKEAQVICRMSEKDSHTCDCGGKMKVVIKATPTNYQTFGYGTDRKRG